VHSNHNHNNDVAANVQGQEIFQVVDEGRAKRSFERNLSCAHVRLHRVGHDREDQVVRGQMELRGHPRKEVSSIFKKELNGAPNFNSTYRSLSRLYWLPPVHLKENCGILVSSLVVEEGLSSRCWFESHAY
jgi:hypothetical protein